jgi:hypothetical protein
MIVVKSLPRKTAAWREMLPQFGAIIDEGRVVRDGNILSGGAGRAERRVRFNAWAAAHRAVQAM